MEEYNRHINELKNIIILWEEEIKQKEILWTHMIKYYEEKQYLENTLDLECNSYV